MMHQEPEIIKPIAEFLQEQLPRAEEDLEAHIIGLDALRFDLAQATVDQLRLLQEKRKQMLWPKDAEKNLTELDRTVRLNGDLALIERDYEFLKRLEALVQDRLNLGLKFLE